MSSGYGLTGRQGRCFHFWQDFLKCYAECDNTDECRPQAEDYKECLYHRKELARAKIIRDEYLKQQALLKAQGSIEKKGHGAD